MPTPRFQFGLVPIETPDRRLTRTVLPLKAVQCKFLVRGGMVEVEMTQVYRQENAQPLDCQYLFPLPADASVYLCEAFINDRVIRARVEEREQARQLAQQKKEAGHRTALVEAQRDNLFILSLTNLQPEDLVEVRLAYFQPLRRLADQFSVEIPFCPGVRYIPGKTLLRSNRGKGIVDDTDQVPDASVISPPRIDSAHPDTAFMDVTGQIDAAFIDHHSLVSPSHEFLSKKRDDMLEITLTRKDEVPDSDFVLRWKEKPAKELSPRAWNSNKDGYQYALMEIRAPEVSNDAPTTPQDIYFLVDNSGSMAGEKWRKAVEALQSCVQIMADEDRAMITLFESKYRDFAEKPLSRAEIANDRNFQGLKETAANGGTEMSPALQHVIELVSKHSAERRTNLVLITDAQIGNDSEILRLLKPYPNLAAHCFGIDIALNDALLLALTRQQGGTFHSLNPVDDIAGAVTQLGRTLRQPVLLNLRCSPGWDLPSARIPDLYAGQVHYASARTSTGTEDLFMEGNDASGHPVRIDFSMKAVETNEACLHWFKARLQMLLSEQKTKEAIELSKRTNLICPLTAFVAWDELEQVAVANHELIQPSMEMRKVMFATRAVHACRLARPGSSTDIDPKDMTFGLMAENIPSRFLLKTTVVKEQLADICNLAGYKDWRSDRSVIMDWARVPDPKQEREQRLQELFEALQPIAGRISVLRTALTAIEGGAAPKTAALRSLFKAIEKRELSDREPIQSMLRAIRDLEQLLESLASTSAEIVKAQQEIETRLKMFIATHVQAHSNSAISKA